MTVVESLYYALISKGGSNISTIWRVKLLGGLTVQYQAKTLTQFHRRGSGELLGYLAYYPKRRFSREHLADLFWPDATRDNGLNNLRVTLSYLRKELRTEFFLTELDLQRFLICHPTGFLELNHQVYSTDVEELKKAIGTCMNSPQKSDCLKQALDLYEGELLGGYSRNPNFHSWLQTEQGVLSQTYLDVLHHLIHALVRGGYLFEARQYSYQGIKLAPERIEFHLNWLRLNIAIGRQDLAIQYYQDLDPRIRAALGVTIQDLTSMNTQSSHSNNGKNR